MTCFNSEYNLRHIMTQRKMPIVPISYSYFLYFLFVFLHGDGKTQTFSQSKSLLVRKFINYAK